LDQVFAKLQKEQILRIKVEVFSLDSTPVKVHADGVNMIPVVPPKSNRRGPWNHDCELYKKRNHVERLFRRLKGFRRIFVASRNWTLCFWPSST
jgi:hypothetical protein